MKFIWNVYRYNSKEIEIFNIFDHKRFLNDVKTDLKKCDTKEVFVEKLKKHLMYYFWSKCEYEVVVTPWAPSIDQKELDRLNDENDKFYNVYNYYPRVCFVNPTISKKIDIYSQVMLNYDVFADYVWSHKKNRSR